MLDTVLLDGDVIIHRAVHASTKVDRFGDVLVPSCDIAAGEAYVDHEVAKTVEHFGARNAVVCLSYDGPHFRTEAMPTYKAHRGTERAMGWAEIRAYAMEHYRCPQWAPLEADDVLGIIGTAPREQRAKLPSVPRVLGDRMIVSIDKDLKTIPGLYSNSFEGVIQEISETEADRNFMLQTLVGDRVDGFPGCPGVGVKTAEKLLAGHSNIKSMWEVVLRTYEKKKLGYEEALANARCARILRWGEYDHTTQAVKFWEPPV